MWNPKEVKNIQHASSTAYTELLHIAVGYGCNCAIRQSSGKYICILDAVSP